jgi:hypothetical protein
VPPMPPFGYAWIFVGFDVFGVAHWDLVMV